MIDQCRELDIFLLLFVEQCPVAVEFRLECPLAMGCVGVSDRLRDDDVFGKGHRMGDGGDDDARLGSEPVGPVEPRGGEQAQDDQRNHTQGHRPTNKRGLMMHGETPKNGNDDFLLAYTNSVISG